MSAVKQQPTAEQLVLLQRAKADQEAVLRSRLATSEQLRYRDEALQEAREAGCTPTMIEEYVGLTRAGIYFIAKRTQEAGQ